MKPVNQADYGVKRGVLEDVFKKVGIHSSTNLHESQRSSGFREL